MRPKLVCSQILRARSPVSTLLLNETQADPATGMLLEMENAELIQLIENQEALNGKVAEAMVVLEEFAKADQQANV